MKKGWTITRLIAVGSFGVLRVLIWIPFIALNISTSNPLSTAFSLFFFSLIVVFSLLTLRLFGTVTIQTFIEYSLEIPLPSMAFGPLLFAAAILRALVVDILFLLLQNRTKAVSLVCGGANSLIFALLTYIIYLVMGIPGTQNIPSFILTPTGLLFLFVIIFGIGSAGGYLGYLAYQKMANTAVIKRIQRRTV